MTDVWLTVAVLAVVNLAYKAFGPVLAGGRELPAAFDRVLSAAIPALMVSLIVIGVFSSRQELVLDARAAGLAAAAAALALRAPLLVVLGVAALACALLRLAV